MMADRAADSALRDLESARADFLVALAQGDPRAIEALRVRYDALEHRWRARVQAQIEAARRTAATPVSPASSDETG